ncbi:electron transfer flavoprotein-ubiquinone oxidoreductase [Teredinibacter franksiae]|uniref:electron transfer flavoprotein-ubiquinone oxidoreductase n=1 Tax=Teredinibacter franksiae TaxID=2761453 RepID=UPI0016267697|nr:electron transfer flavoprotein-ubiquinone oxidoreductase [Teredinibacter franksiae]
MQYDVVIVGAGPAGLSSACRLKQINADLSVCVVEKSAEVGGHILSGAVFEPRVLSELFPNWQDNGAPLHQPTTRDEVLLLRNSKASATIPSLFAPKTMHNKGNYIVSVANLCRWLAEQAESLGVEIFPGFTAAELVVDDKGAVKGIVTGDMGVAADGSEKDTYMPGMELNGHYTIFAEGCRGHLGKQLIQQFALDAGKTPQHYGIGFKELWKVPAEQHQPGLVVHTAGWPLSESGSPGGGFLYHMEDQQVAVGLVVDLSYSNPHLSPYDEFQRYKHHPQLSKHLNNGERIAYGARALVKGGLQALPKQYFPGGLLIGDDAGTLNFAKIKGTHTAMKSGMLAAECIANALADNRQQDTLIEYEKLFNDSWVYQELYVQRNFGPAQHKWGNFVGSAYAFVDINLFNGKLPWTLKDTKPDHEQLVKASAAKKIPYPKADGVLSFDKLSSVFLSNANHEEDQPCHLKLADLGIATGTNLVDYDEPAQRYCPAGVYEIIKDDSDNARFQINAQNCIHCKTCDIKDPAQNITWVPPEGGGGPNYPNM